MEILGLIKGATALQNSIILQVFVTLKHYMLPHVTADV